MFEKHPRLARQEPLLVYEVPETLACLHIRKAYRHKMVPSARE